MRTSTRASELDIDRIKRLDRLEAEVTYGLMQALWAVVGDDDDALREVATAAQQVQRLSAALPQ